MLKEWRYKKEMPNTKGTSTAQLGVIKQNAALK